MKNASIVCLVVCTAVAGCQREEKVTEVYTGFQALAGAIDMFEVDTGRYPDDLKELYDPENIPSGWAGPWIKPEWLIDAWGKQIRYTKLKKSFEIRSAGPDGKFNTKDDLTNRPDTEHAGDRRRSAGP